MEPEDRIIPALDVDNLTAAESLVRDLAPHVGPFKVGLQLLTSEGDPAVVQKMHMLNAKVFADKKLKDIPNTVAGASRAISKLGVAMFNVHASGGIDTMIAAVQNKGSSLVLAVTVLTSMDEENTHLTYSGPSKVKVLQYAREAKLAGVDGIICSPQELPLLKKRPELEGLLYVTPGIRPKWAVAGDQKRITTPADAIKAGANYLVIGRPITKPPAEIGTPVDAAKRIAEEIAAALA